MKNNEIIAIAPINLTDHTFKDERLAKATQRIAAIYNDAAKYAEAKNRDIAKILGEVADKKAYEQDGFKSVADYAHTVFGIAANNAYALARAGKIYNDKGAHVELKAMSPSKLAELNAVDQKLIEDALNTGKITHESTQKALREFAESAKDTNDTEKPVVLNLYTARPCVNFVDQKTMDDYNSARTIYEWDDFFIDMVIRSSDTSVEIVNLKKTVIHHNNVNRTAIRRLYFSRTYSIVVEFYKVVPEKKNQGDKKSKPVQKFTKEELQKMLAEAEED